jgi:hypothetical protein
MTEAGEQQPYRDVCFGVQLGATEDGASHTATLYGDCAEHERDTGFR